MAEKKKTSEAKLAAIRRYEANKYDIISIRLPKGTKQRITDTGQSVNGYVVDATLKKLESESTSS